MFLVFVDFVTERVFLCSEIERVGSKGWQASARVSPHTGSTIRRDRSVCPSVVASTSKLNQRQHRLNLTYGGNESPQILQNCSDRFVSVLHGTLFIHNQCCLQEVGKVTKISQKRRNTKNSRKG